tara:strand:- start:444 stop:1010 length:567 start_codon:yes stop_codon:yes gene_type:complete
MAFTNIKYDPCRIAKDLQISTETGRYHIAVPGPGNKVPFEEDPHVRLQKYGANLRTNTINLESDLMGLTRSLNRDCVGLNQYTSHQVKSSRMNYSSQQPFTEQSRVTHPAWLYKDLEQVNWNILPLNPQANVCLPFHNNLSTRILEKDYYVPEYPCVEDNNHGELPAHVYMNSNKNTQCTDLRSCGNL